MNDPTNHSTDMDMHGSSGEQERMMPSAPGAQLAAHRQERGWTIEQVASQLNLAPRQVIAIEADDYPSLPGMPIVRGFIRAYAKLLKIDAAPLLASLGGETMFAHEAISSRKTLSAPFSETRLPSMMDRPAMSSKWLIGVLFAVLLGVGLWASRQTGQLESMSKSASSQLRDGIAYLSGSNSNSKPGSEAGQAASVPAASSAPRAASVPAPTNLSGNDTPAPAASTGSAIEASDPTPVTQQTAPAQSSASSATANVPAPASAQPSPERNTAATSQAPEPATSKDSLIFTATQDSWIEVKSVSKKKVLLARLVKAGTTETVTVSEPVTAVIGNAAGVEATLRGAPVDIKAGAGNVARLTLK